MATAAENDFYCNLVHITTLELEHKVNFDPEYTGLVVLSPEMVMVVDFKAGNLYVHCLQDGRLLAKYSRPGFDPCDICICNIHDNDIQIAVSQFDSGQIEILSIKCTDQTSGITQVWTTDIQKEFDSCQGVKSLKGHLLISGVKRDSMHSQYNICWGIVSLTNDHMEISHKICKCGKSGLSYLSTNNEDIDNVYISCDADDGYSYNTGVYGYRNSQQNFLYQHKDLNYPRGITVDRLGFIFVCNWNSPPCIHHLTGRGQLMTIYSEGIPLNPKAIFYEEYKGLLYVTSFNSTVITALGALYSGHQDPVIPAEVLKMDARSLHMYREALRRGTEEVYNIRVMVVGQHGVGKTTLTKRLLGKCVNIAERIRTEGIDVHIECCNVCLATGQWNTQDEKAEHDNLLQRLAKALNENQLRMHPESERTPDGTKNSLSSQLNTVQNPLSTASHKLESSSVVVPSEVTQSDTLTMARPGPGGDFSNESHNIDPMKELIQFMNNNGDILQQDTDKNSLLSVWDFAGHYAFYTTHQTFLTRRAIYLLVSDVSGQVTDLVDDECYFDSKGIMKCKVHELIEVWLNSIHSCAPSPNAGIPPVILVGTHVDKISQPQTMASDPIEPTLPKTSTATVTSAIFGLVCKCFHQEKMTSNDEPSPVSRLEGASALPVVDQPKTQNKQTSLERTEMRVDADTEKTYRDAVCQRYFKEVRSYLSDKPTRFHLVDEDFAIDNTVVDSNLEALKWKILEVASHQPYFGEERPTQWLPLEQKLMLLKAAGVRVIPLSLVEELNLTGAVNIPKDELDLFLRFQHEIGTILYFSMEILKEKIVLDPQWMIDALKSLITAEMFVMRRNPAVFDKWFEFKNNGKLFPELIDAIWTKEDNVELYVNKEHILLLMEKLHIIAKPRSFDENGEKVEDYFLAPCMLRQESPIEVISPEQNPQMVSTPVLCLVFRGGFMPPPIFHRLLAACLAHWPVAKKKDTSENLIFCGCCVFDLDLFHRLTMHCMNHVVFARVTRMVIDDVKIPNAYLCTRVREFITLNLNKITSCLDQNLQYELCVHSTPSQCDHNDSMPCLPPLSEVWFTDEGHDRDAPITSEHMNHARLCIAIITVCGNALRGILLTSCPVPYKDIYQAILANEDKLTGVSGRPLLNMDQVQLVFPDPPGSTGTVEQFDITLLYTLIRNVSMVHAPSTGWGNDPQDQPRDKSLGASVERIRCYRNHISGHSAEGKISKQDFEIFWNQIDAVLCDIEDVIFGKQVYSQELKKQKKQVISIYEAC